MSRSKWKPPFIDKKLASIKQQAKKVNKIKTYSRNSIITPNLINSIIDIHNGIRFFQIVVKKDMVGHKLGEFAPTRKKPLIKKKKNKK